MANMEEKTVRLRYINKLTRFKRKLAPGIISAPVLSAGILVRLNINQTMLMCGKVAHKNLTDGSLLFCIFFLNLRKNACL
ncbi:hypothetical protein D3Z36_09030 [Lachnospiraceae bacterium]|nr:hypothetical protein [Lachnospiraceae bacterium]